RMRQAPFPETVALKARIDEALAANRAGDEGEDASAILRRSREGRDLGAWVGALRKLLGQEATFRAQPVAPDALWRVVEDGAADAPARAAAAIALAPSLDEQGKGRLRVVAGATAEPKL